MSNAKYANTFPKFTSDWGQENSPIMFFCWLQVSYHWLGNIITNFLLNFLKYKYSNKLSYLFIPREHRTQIERT